MPNDYNCSYQIQGDEIVMEFIVEAFFSGCISKIINDGKEYSWDKVKNVINDKNNRNLSTRIYRIIEKAFIKVTDKKFKDTDKLYEAIEKIFTEFRDNGSTIESVKSGLGTFNSDITVERCENFLEKFYDEICQDEELHRRISLSLQEKGININQQEFQKINETVGYGFTEINKKMDKIDEKISINNKNDNEENLQSKELVKSRTQEYADKWEANMFLNDFDEWDENAGVNVKLSDVYIDKHLPHFKFGHNEKESDNLNVLLSKHIMKTKENKMLLILGQPGIGKSTLITWITVNFADRINDILVYRFASDLRSMDWNNGRISNRVLEKLGLNHSVLNGKILILDGFDEVSIEVNRRKDILDSLYGDWIYNKAIDNFSLIVTCRENYVPRFAILKCKYIILQPLDEIQIKSFCNIFQEKLKNAISENTIEKLLENKEILGIPLILYMVLALNISIEKEGSIVDVYDKIFSLEGGIYDRCIDNKMFADKHRIGEIKEYIHQISRDIAIWMFENEADKASIPQEEYKKICRIIMQGEKKNKEIGQDFLIGNFFKLVKHCDGIETEELYFVHRSIYEYFVIEVICNSIKSLLEKIDYEDVNKLYMKIACICGLYLKGNNLSITMMNYMKHKIENSILNEKFDVINETFQLMLRDGMTYYTGVCYKNVINCEKNIFTNMLEILHLWNNTSLKFDKLFRPYLLLDIGKLNLSNIDLTGVDLTNVNLNGADMRGTLIRKDTFKGVKIEESIWLEDDIKRMLPQVKESGFVFIYIEKEGCRKKVLRSEIVLNQIGL